VQLQVEAQPRDGHAGWCLSVRDTGRGLSGEQCTQLFEPFNRLGAECDGIEGTGIGLAIVHHLVQLMGGAIEVSSRPAEGSEFRVWLRGAAQAEAAAEQSPQASVVADDAASRAPLSVLYIEDNPLNVLLVEELLSRREHTRLRCAPDGKSGVAAAHEMRPDLVLIDMQLPISTVSKCCAGCAATARSARHAASRCLPTRWLTTWPAPAPPASTTTGPSRSTLPSFWVASTRWRHAVRSKASRAGPRARSSGCEPDQVEAVVDVAADHQRLAREFVDTPAA
jgi:CheY-like chemotaxis protein